MTYILDGLKMLKMLTTYFWSKTVLCARAFMRPIKDSVPDFRYLGTIFPCSPDAVSVASPVLLLVYQIYDKIF